jgi:hypothetical protein
MKDSIKKILDKINKLTDRLRREKPVVYEHLMENPETIPNKKKPNLELELITYYETLKKFLNDSLNK